MAYNINDIFICMLLLCFLGSSHGFEFNFSSVHGYTPGHKLYIVYMGLHSFSDPESVMNANHELLASCVGGSVHQARTKIVHHYHKSFRGFSALLSSQQANEIGKHGSVVSVFEDEMVELHTTRSWDFLLEQQANNYGNGAFKGRFNYHRDNPLADIVIASIDSGIWPESRSFNSKGMNDISHTTFRGVCTIAGEDNIPPPRCNNKVVGTRYYHQGVTITKYNGILSPRDDFGHGTHTIATAAGRDVFYNNFGGYKIKGGAPHSRIAVYKACWQNYCSKADLLSAFDDAIDDRVNIITLSVGRPLSVGSSIFEDAISIGALHAYRKGILVITSGGNFGAQGPYTVQNPAPWVLTVAATSTDRQFSTDIVLGNGQVIKGYGLLAKDYKDGILTWQNSSTNYAGKCHKEEVDPNYVKGKVVVCAIVDGVEYGEKAASPVQLAGAAGMIFVDALENGKMVFDFSKPGPVTLLHDYPILENYINSNNRPTVSISRTVTRTHATPAPTVASFSGKGPNPVIPEIIKPDLAAPGVTILSAYPGSPIYNPYFDMFMIQSNLARFGAMSGTSMACPHVSGVATVLKSFNPNVSPDWLKSALITTATIADNTGNYIRSSSGNIATPFEVGAGNIVPDLVFNPGLVYEVTNDNFLGFLCTQAARYSNRNSKVSKMIFEDVKCEDIAVPSYNLNHPSIAINGWGSRKVTVKRTVNLASVDSPKLYSLVSGMPNSVRVVASTSLLDFRDGSTSKDFYLQFQNINAKTNVYGFIAWTDNSTYFVKSPVALIF